MAAALSLVARSQGADPAESLHQIIDREIAAQAGGPMAKPAMDAEFLRRAYLDLAGRIPSSQEVREFFAAESSTKRTELIDRLLASSEFPRHMQEAWTVMLLERREGKAVADEAWNAYLRQAFADGKPWDALVRELIAADGSEKDSGPAIRFFVDGGRAEAHQLTQDFARLLLGMNLQCAQCHDHPSISDYKQSHYYGLYAYLGQSKLANDKQSRPRRVETVMRGKVDFVSVFHPEDKRATGPKLLEDTELEVPAFAKGEEFSQPPQDGLPGIPKFQPRKRLAENLTTASPVGRQFARNAVNRFWFLLLGRGLVHPLDLDHSANAPSHRDLLEQLTDAFISHLYNVRWLVREICLSAAYQRASQSEDFDPQQTAPESYRRGLLKPLSAEQLARSLAEATGQRLHLDQGDRPEKPLTYKDYSNGRTAVPGNWPDVLVVFAGAFGHPAGQAEIDFRPSVEHALFLANDRLVRDWLQPRAGSLTERLSAMEPPTAAVDEAYLSLLTRYPTTVERELATSLVAAGDDRLSALQDLCLALITSAEFRLNH